jgi:hypothetical protein
MRKNKKFIDPRYFMDEKTELTEARLPAWERPGYVPEPGLGPDDPYDEKSQKTNMNRNLRGFAEWILEVDGHIESLSGEYVSADEIPSDVNLYDLWYQGTPSSQAAQDLISGDY